jgi:hypothetical protein
VIPAARRSPPGECNAPSSGFAGLGRVIFESRASRFRATDREQREALRGAAGIEIRLQHKSREGVSSFPLEARIVQNRSSRNVLHLALTAPDY